MAVLVVVCSEVECASINKIETSFLLTDLSGRVSRCDLT
jgi:hypothetical protein